MSYVLNEEAACSHSHFPFRLLRILCLKLYQMTFLGKHCNLAPPGGSELSSVIL